MSSAPDQNPFQSPATVADDIAPVKAVSGNDLRRVAVSQRLLTLCATLQVAALILLTCVPVLHFQRQNSRVDDLVYTILVEAAAISVYVVAFIIATLAAIAVVTRVCTPRAGVLTILLAIIPVAGFIALYHVDRKARAYLRARGIRVGFYGADVGRTF